MVLTVPSSRSESAFCDVRSSSFPPQCEGDMQQNVLDVEESSRVGEEVDHREEQLGQRDESDSAEISTVEYSREGTSDQSMVLRFMQPIERNGQRLIDGVLQFQQIRIEG